MLKLVFSITTAPEPANTELIERIGASERLDIASEKFLSDDTHP